MIKIQKQIVIKGLPELLCIAGAIYLASNGLEGWGWLLLIAVLI